METSAKTCIFHGVTLILISLLLGLPAMAQTPKKDSYVRDVELCNRLDLNALDSRIKGCTALIEEGDRKATALAIAYNNRGNAYATKADYNRAIQDFDQSIKLNPGYAKPFNNRGVVYLRKGEIDHAIEAFDQAIKLDANYAEAFANRAEAYLKQSKYDRAVRDYDDAIRIAPDLNSAWSGRCWARAVLGALQAALEDCNKALQAGANAATYDSRGLIDLRMGQFGEAIDSYGAALHLDPRLASALYGRGLARLKQGDKVNGETDIETAKSIQANIGDEFTRYGVSLEAGQSQ